MCVNSFLICGTTSKRNREEQALINSVGLFINLKTPWDGCLGSVMEEQLWWRQNYIFITSVMGEMNWVCVEAGPLTVYKAGWHQSSQKVKPTHLNCPLVAGCSIGHKPCFLHVNGWDQVTRKNTGLWSKFYIMAKSGITHRFTLWKWIHFFELHNPCEMACFTISIWFQSHNERLLWFQNDVTRARW